MTTENLLPLLISPDPDHRQLLSLLNVYFRSAKASDKDVIFFPSSGRHRLLVKVEETEYAISGAD